MVVKRCFLFLLTFIPCLLQPGLSLSGVNAPELRERIQVLAQAQEKASAELAFKQERGAAGKEDIAHYQTVSHFLKQQIDEACKALADQGGKTSGLPCPQAPARPLQKVIHKTSAPAAKAVPQPHRPEHQRVHQKIAEAKPQRQPVQEITPEPVVQKTKKALPEKKPTGFFATIAQWLKSLFMPKPPPSSPAVSSTNSQQKNKNHASQQQTENRSENQQNTHALNASEKSTSPGKSGSRGRTEAGKQRPNMQKKTGAGSTIPAQDKLNPVKKTGPADQQHPKKHNVNKGSAKTSTTETGRRNAQTQHTPSRSGGKQKMQKPGARAAMSGRENNARQRMPVSSGSLRNQTHKQAKKNVAAQQPTHSEGEQGQKKSDNRKGATGTKEDIRKLEKSLDAALGEFDGTLLNAQERLSSRVPSRREGGESGAYGAEDGGTLNNGRSGNSENGAGALAAETVGQRASIDTNTPGGVAASGGRIKSGSGRSTIGADDDIVARQLREAAEKEQDPVLKKKLWLEYKKYKAGR